MALSRTAWIAGGLVARLLLIAVLALTVQSRFSNRTYYDFKAAGYNNDLQSYTYVRRRRLRRRRARGYSLTTISKLQTLLKRFLLVLCVYMLHACAIGKKNIGTRWSRRSSGWLAACCRPRSPSTSSAGASG
jgi:hypothetical protein